MIIVHLQGGLGNQLFQYAIGRRLSEERNVSLRFDLETYQNRSQYRAYKLHHFRVVGKPASPFDMARIGTRDDSPLMLRMYHRLFWQKRARDKIFFVEKQRTFDTEILHAPRNAYLRGYWQTERYFRDIRSLLLTEIRLRVPVAGQDLIVAKLIEESAASVSIHVRRGDYASNVSATRFHGLLALEYYYKAAQFIKARVENPRFFVFSDDLPWAKENLKLDDPTIFVDHNTVDNDHLDFALMSRCHHHIVANSSFSWWSAWLSDSPDKIVVAPQQWYVIQDATRRDLIPETWFRL